MKNLSSMLILGCLALFGSCVEKGSNSNPRATAGTPVTTNQQQAKPIAIAAVSAHCKECNSCAEPACVTEILEHHRLTDTEFFMLSVEYYADNGVNVLHIPDPLKKDRVYIETLLAGVDCTTNCVEFDIKGADLTTHQNMELKIYAGCPPPKPYDKYYSIALFKGILSIVPAPTRFEFVRLYDKNVRIGSLGIIAYAGAVPVYYGDLSSDFPIL